MRAFPVRLLIGLTLVLATAATCGAEEQAEPFHFFKLSSIPTTSQHDLKYAMVAVDLQQMAMLSRNYLVSRGQDVRALIRAYLWNLDGTRARPKRLADSTSFGFVPQSNLAYHVLWSRGVQLFDTQTHQPSGAPIPHELREDTTIGPAVSPDGKVMVTRSQLDQLQFWNIAARRPITGALKQPGNVTSMAFVADGEWFLAKAGGRLTVWKPTGTRVAGPFRHDIGSFVCSPGGQRIVTVENTDPFQTTGQSELVLRSGDDLTEARRLKLPGVVWRANWLDEAHLLVISNRPRERRSLPYQGERLQVVSFSGQQAVVQTLLDGAPVRGVAIPPHGRYFFTRSRAKTSCWQVGQSQPIWSKRGSHEVSFGDGWVLLQNDVAIVCTLETGEELWRQEVVLNAGVQGAQFWTCNEEQIDVWAVQRNAQVPGNAN